MRRPLRSGIFAPVIALLLTPAVLATLVLAAHFLRRGAWGGVALSLALLALLAVPRTWARRLVQLGLVLAAAEWARTLLAFAAEWRAAGEPWVRMAVILGAVIAVTLAGAALLEAPRVRARCSSAAPRS